MSLWKVLAKKDDEKKTQRRLSRLGSTSEPKRGKVSENFGSAGVNFGAVSEPPRPRNQYSVGVESVV